MAGEDKAPGLDPVSLGLKAFDEVKSLGFGLAQLFGAGNRLKKEEAELAALKQPMYNIQNEYFQNKNQSEIGASYGTPQTTRDFLSKQRETGLSTSISGLLQGGAMPGDITKLFDSYDNSISTDAARSVEQQQKNIQMYMEMNKELAGQKTTQWAINEYQPYEQKLNELKSNIAIEKGNKQQALQMMAGTASANSVARSNDELLGNKSIVQQLLESLKNKNTGTGNDYVPEIGIGGRGNLPGSIRSELR